MLLSTDVPVLTAYDCLFLDIDGVIHRSGIPIPTAVDSVNAATRDGVGVRYLTNNASRTPEQVCETLKACGLAASSNEIVTSALAIAERMAQDLPQGSDVFVVGSDGLIDALRDHGLVPLNKDSLGTVRPHAAVQGHSPDTSWRDLAALIDLIDQGVPWYASNTDFTMPTNTGLAPGNGAFVRMVEEISGQRPIIAGKPQVGLFESARRSSGARAPLMVGDRLDTDIEGARSAGVDSVWVATGVHQLPDIIAASPEQRPDLVLPDMSGLARAQAEVVVTRGAAECGSARVVHRDGRLTLAQPGRHGEEGLRAAVALGWSIRDVGNSTPIPDGTLTL